ncbi:MAG: hypothetical protein M3441_12765 [Chloroflexota bacterium]|nr:hypothetical protein [Chloroflexota bacterium]
MSKESRTSRVHLLSDSLGVSLAQLQVDFVIPNLVNDLPLCIDPFLLFKSKDLGLRELHGHIVSIFNQAINWFRQGHIRELQRLIDFPEVNEIGLGYSEGGIRGSGLGIQMNQLLIGTLRVSEPLQERGLKHVEELQLVTIGVGADRISDIVGNILKSYLIEYTQRQCDIWKIPLTKNLPINHYFDFVDWQWTDGYFDLPLNPHNGRPILLVPRRIVRLLPWINYDDYLRTDYRLFLRPSSRTRHPRYPGMPKSARLEASKSDVVRVTQQQVQLLDQYIGRKEREGGNAAPELVDDSHWGEVERRLGDELSARLVTIPSGSTGATLYQQWVYEVLNYLFEPELTDGSLEVETFLGTERRDIIYTNEAETSFWAFVRNTYATPVIMFEVKNVQELQLDHVNQTAAYLGARLGMLGFIVTRNAAGANIERKVYTIYNDSPTIPKKLILIMNDEDLLSMIKLKQENEAPVRYIQRLYRKFVTSVQ